MNKTTLFSIILFIGSYAFAQDFNRPTESDYPKLPFYGKSVNDFVPKNWKVFARAFGDLNGDKKVDCALVLKAAHAKFINPNDGLGSNPFDTNPRILVVLFKDENGYKVAKQSNTFILIPESPTMSEPFQKVQIDNGVLQMKFELWYSAGSWSASEYLYKFKFLNKEFVLIGADKTESMRNSGETESRSYNFLTGKLKITTGNFAGDEKKKVRWKTYKIKRLKTFDTFRAPLTWQIERDYYV